MQYLIMGAIEESYGLWFFTTALISSYFGQKVVNSLVKKYNKTAFIVIALGSVITVSTILLVYVGSKSVISDVNQNRNLKFNPLC